MERGPRTGLWDTSPFKDCVACVMESARKYIDRERKTGEAFVTEARREDMVHKGSEQHFQMLELY